MEIRDFAFQPAHFTEGKGLQLRPLIKCEHFRTRQVCKTCNSGWMSNLEGWAKARIGPAVAPGFSLNAMNQLLVGNAELELMIRWLLKTAVIFELASPRGDLQAVNPELFPVAAGRAAMSDFHVWVGYIPDANFLVHLTRGFPTWNAGQLAYQVHSASVDFALQLNHLAIRLIRCPEATAGLKLAHVITDGTTVIRSVPFVLLVRLGSSCRTPISFETFMHFSMCSRCMPIRLSLNRGRNQAARLGWGVGRRVSPCICARPLPNGRSRIRAGEDR